MSHQLINGCEFAGVDAKKKSTLTGLVLQWDLRTAYNNNPIPAALCRLEETLRTSVSLTSSRYRYKGYNTAALTSNLYNTISAT